MRLCILAKNPISIVVVVSEEKNLCYSEASALQCNMRLTQTAEFDRLYSIISELYMISFREALGRVKNKLEETILVFCKNVNSQYWMKQGCPVWNNHTSELWLHSSRHVNGLIHMKLFHSIIAKSRNFLYTETPARRPFLWVCCLRWLIFLILHWNCFRFFEHKQWTLVIMWQVIVFAGDGACRPPTLCVHVCCFCFRSHFSLKGVFFSLKININTEQWTVSTPHVAGNSFCRRGSLPADPLCACVLLLFSVIVLIFHCKLFSFLWRST